MSRPTTMIAAPGIDRLTVRNVNSSRYDPMSSPAPTAQSGTAAYRGTATTWRARPTNTSPHQCTWRRSKFRRFPPPISPIRSARPITAKMGDMRVSCPAATSSSRSPDPNERRYALLMAEPDEDLGYFGPGSVSWQVDREVTVLFGGARALLMQAAHPLVVAGVNQTQMYERSPWKRLQRTLMLSFTITFGTTAEAHAAADRINEVHARIKGTDPVTGKTYDALDPHLLLYVHATLVDSALLYEELTIGRLDDEGRQRFHEEQMLAAELVRIPKESIPPTVPALRAWLADVEDRGELAVTEGALRVAGLFMDPPHDAEWRPILPQVARLAFGTLSPLVREMYGIRWNATKEAALRSTFALMRTARPLLPAKYRYVEPYSDWVREGRRTPTLRSARPRG